MDVDVRPLGTSTSVNVRSVNRPLYNVVDRARSHAADDPSVNHGGVAIIADIALSPIDIADQPTTFDIVCARARVSCFAAIVVLLYRPGSQPLQQQTFIDQLTPVLEGVKFDVAFMHRIVSRYFV